MPVVHYLPRVAASAVVATEKATAEPIVKPTIPIVTTAKTTAIAKTSPVVAPPATTLAKPISSVVPSSTLPITTSSVITTATTTPLILTSQSTPLATSTTPAKTTTAPTSMVASASASTSPSASASATVSPSSSSSVTVLTAGIAGAVAGVVITALLIAFFLRRWNRRGRRHGRESINFSAKEFRRSAQMLQDPFHNPGSVRSMAMDYQHAPMPAHQPYALMDSPTPGYFSNTNTPRHSASGYLTPHNQFYAPSLQQGYPPQFHQQGGFRTDGHPGPAPHAHYYEENEDQAYGGNV
ncbi:hypothetical protein DFH07DRAFT_821111, partial [Mycena maculata]